LIISVTLNNRSHANLFKKRSRDLHEAIAGMTDTFALIREGVFICFGIFLLFCSFSLLNKLSRREISAARIFLEDVLFSRIILAMLCFLVLSLVGSGLVGIYLISEMEVFRVAGGIFLMGGIVFLSLALYEFNRILGG